MKLNQTCDGQVRSTEQLLVYLFRAYVTPGIILVGLFGNLLVMTAFTRMQRKSACRFNLYAIAIAVAHTTELLFNAFLDDFLGRGLFWLTGCQLMIKVDVYSNAMCKMISYVPRAAALISTNLLILFSLDRVLTVYKPLKFRGDNYLNAAGLSIILVYVVSFVVYLPLPIQSGIVENHSRGVLSKKCQYMDPLNIGSQYTLYLHIFGSNIFPSLFVLITNVMIFLKLREMLEERKRLSVHATPRSSVESRRILGHLGMTTTFSVIMIPIIVAIVLRQHADYHNYAELYPDYEDRLVQLSKLFSSIESIYFVTEFPTFLIFLPMFRQELCLMFTHPCQLQPTHGMAHLAKFTPRMMRSIVNRSQATTGFSASGKLTESPRPNKTEKAKRTLDDTSVEHPDAK